MNTSLLPMSSAEPTYHDHQDADSAILTVTSYLIRCGVRRPQTLRELSARIVSNALANDTSFRAARSEWTIVNGVMIEPRGIDFDRVQQRRLSRCLSSAAEVIRGLPDRWVQVQRDTHTAGMPSKQFAVAGLDELLFIPDAVHPRSPVDSSLSDVALGDVTLGGHSRCRAYVVIPPARIRPMKRNSTPAMIGPLRSDWWMVLAAKCLAFFTTAQPVRSRMEPAMSLSGALGLKETCRDES